MKYQNIEIPLKAYPIKDLANYYGVRVGLLLQWIKTDVFLIGKLLVEGYQDGLEALTLKQVQIIFNRLGRPEERILIKEVSEKQG